MTVYQWLCLFGVQAVFTTIIGVLINRIGKSVKSKSGESEAIKKGIQAVLRDRLYQLHRVCNERGYVTDIDLKNFMQMYEQYHNLGANGVMDAIKVNFVKLPIR